MTFDNMINQMTNLKFLIEFLEKSDITKQEIINLLKINQEIQHEKNQIISYENFLKRTINYLTEKEQKKQAGIYRENLNNTKEKIKELEKEFVETVEKIQYRNSEKTSLFYRLGEIQEEVRKKIRSHK